MKNTSTTMNRTTTLNSKKAFLSLFKSLMEISISQSRMCLELLMKISKIPLKKTIQVDLVPALLPKQLREKDLPQIYILSNSTV